MSDLQETPLTRLFAELIADLGGDVRAGTTARAYQHGLRQFQSMTAGWCVLTLEQVTREVIRALHIRTR